MDTPENPFAPHDHEDCRSAAREAAAGLRLTPIRRRVFDCLTASHVALGAYDIVAALSGSGRAVQATQVYRALDFLAAQGLAHRIEGLNAFVACARPGSSHDALFMICRDCRRVAETPLDRPPARLESAAAQSGFAVESTTVEATGLCPTCRERT